MIKHSRTFSSTLPAVRYQSADEGHRVHIEGTSNIHDWSGTTDQISGWIDIPGRWINQAGELCMELTRQTTDAAPRIHVQIPVRSLKGNHQGLASHIHAELKAANHPYVTFTLETLNRNAAADRDVTTWSAHGQLEIAGARRSVELPLILTPLSDSRLRIEVQKDLLMTDFGIDPPTAMMGMAQVVNEVRVRVTWIVERQAQRTGYSG
ncbi:MAG: YceI family protein [Phycisphaeraceae bacterium]